MNKRNPLTHTTQTLRWEPKPELQRMRRNLMRRLGSLTTHEKHLLNAIDDELNRRAEAAA